MPVAAQIGGGGFAPVPFGFVHQRGQFAGVGVETDDVAGADFAYAAAEQGFGRHVDGGGDFARRARHAPVGYQRDLEAPVLQDGQGRREFVQFGHAVGARALEADDADEIAFQFAAFEGGQHFFLVVEHDGGGFDDAAVVFHGGDFYHAAPDVAFHHAQTAVGREGRGCGAQDFGVAAFGYRVLPFQTAFD